MTRKRSDVSRALPAVKSANQDNGSVILKADPLRESSADVWARWSRDKNMREVIEQRKADLANAAMTTKAIYPLECARKLAAEAQRVAPDWRAMRPDLGAAWGSLLKTAVGAGARVDEATGATHSDAVQFAAL